MKEKEKEFTPVDHIDKDPSPFKIMHAQIHTDLVFIVLKGKGSTNVVHILVPFLFLTSRSNFVFKYNFFCWLSTYRGVR